MSERPPTKSMTIDGTAMVRIRPARATDAGELFTLQRAAFVSEAQEYRDAHIAPLRDTVADVERLLRDPRTTVLAAVATADGEHGRRGRVLGSARLTVSGEVGRVGRIVVAPDMQHRGIGSALIEAVHTAASREPGLTVLEIFTGARSSANLALYRRVGYRDAGEVVDDAGTRLRVLRRDLV